MDTMKIPFYKATALFESGQDSDLQEAFLLLTQCALKGNLYAPYYVEYLFKNRTSLPIQMTGMLEQDLSFVQSISTHVELIPADHSPKTYLESSLLIRKYVNLGNSSSSNNKNKEKQGILMRLVDNINSAANAALFLIKNMPSLRELLKEKQEKLKQIENKIQKIADISVISYLAQNTSATNITLSSHQVQEWRLINGTAAALAYVGAGNLERYIAKCYGGSQEVHNSPFLIDMHRKSSWQIKGAHMGNAELQFMYATEDPKSLTAQHNQSLWLMKSAFSGHLMAKILASNNVLMASEKTSLYNPHQAHIFLLEALKSLEKGVVIPPGLIRVLYFDLGQLYEKGLGGHSPNDTMARSFYEKAAELELSWNLSSRDAVFNLAVFYKMGRGGLEKDYQKSMAYYEKSIKDDEDPKQQQKTYMCMASLWVEGGHGLERNFEKAFFCFNQCKDYDASAASLLSTSTAQALRSGTTDKIEAGFQLLIKLADREERSAMIATVGYHLAMQIPQTLISEEKIEVYIKKLLEHATSEECSENQIESQAGVFYYAVKSVPEYQKAFSFFLKGEEKKQPHAIFKLGNLYEVGCEALEIKPDLNKAFHYYSAAAAFEHIAAIHNKGYFLLYGKGCEPNLPLAIECFHRSLSAGFKLSAYNLACCYGCGRGVEQNDTHYFQCLKIAEETGDVDVLFELGLCYLKGRGVTENIQLAMGYFTQALELGDLRSAHNLALLQFNALLGKGEFSLNAVQGVLDTLSLAIDKYPETAYVYALFSLLLDPKDNQSKAMASLEKHPSDLKTNSNLHLLLQLIKRCDYLSILEILLLLTQHVTVPQIEAIHQQAETHPSSSSSIQETTKSAASSSSPICVTNDHPLRRLKEKIEWFCDYKNIKKVSIKGFEQLIGKITSFNENIKYEKRQSKGSNINYSICHQPSGTTLTFSYHPMHKSNASGKDVIDKRRSANLVETMNQVVDLALNSPKI